MRYYAADYRKYARNALAGNWGTALGVALVAALLGGGDGISLPSPSVQFKFSPSDFGSGQGNPEYSLGYELGRYFGEFFRSPVFWVFLSIAAVISLVYLLIGGAVELGLCLYNTKLIRGERPQFSVLFSRFQIFGKALGLYLLTGLFVFLWSLLFIVPGIIASYRYAMAPYLLAEYPEMGVMEAITRSKEMMSGYKGRLFCLNLSFIGWSLLCAFTFGIGYLWLNPYMRAAEAAFYYERMYGFPAPPESGYPGQPQYYQPYPPQYGQPGAYPPPYGTGAPQAGQPYQAYPPQYGQPGACPPPYGTGTPQAGQPYQAYPPQYGQPGAYPPPYGTGAPQAGQPYQPYPPQYGQPGAYPPPYGTGTPPQAGQSDQTDPQSCPPQTSQTGSPAEQAPDTEQPVNPEKTTESAQPEAQELPHESEE